LNATSSLSELPPLQLRPRADKRLRAGHLWIYSNEVDTDATPIRHLEPGEQVMVRSDKGKVMGVAVVNPQTLICARIVSRDSRQRLGRAMLVRRLQRALALREQLFSTPYYRLVFGDSDWLPGLVIDRFDDILVVQLNSAAMERLKHQVTEALIKVINPRAILFKNDSATREVEGLPSYVETALGDVPEVVPVLENGARMLAPIVEGQKTGWFYDHRDNRARMQPLVAGKRVLDLFSYTGGWGLQAAHAGAETVVCVDSSELALTMVEEGARENGFEDRVATMQGRVNDALKVLLAEGEKFDVVIADPPAFIKRRKDQAAGERAYDQLNQQAVRLVNDGGMLISASCSMHMATPRLMDSLRSAAGHCDRDGQVFLQGTQGGDHPVHPAIPETQYLKALFMRVCQR